MFSNGYVGTAQDAARIRRQEKQREEQRKKFEEQQQQQRDKVLNAGLKQFGSSKSEAYEAAFKTETVGLVTREEFMQKRNTIAQRLADEEAREKEAAEAAAAAEKARRKKEKAKAKLKSKLSFLGDDVSRGGRAGCGLMRSTGTRGGGGGAQSGAPRPAVSVAALPSHRAAAPGGVTPLNPLRSTPEPLLPCRPTRRRRRSGRRTRQLRSARAAAPAQARAAGTAAGTAAAPPRRRPSGRSCQSSGRTPRFGRTSCQTRTGSRWRRS
jgi:hypothetical protein